MAVDTAYVDGVHDDAVVLDARAGRHTRVWQRLELEGRGHRGRAGVGAVHVGGRAGQAVGTRDARGHVLARTHVTLDRLCATCTK